MIQELMQALDKPSPLAFVAVFVLGIIVSLGSCTILELPILLGYLGGLQENRRARLFKIVILFTAGMLFSYFIISLAIGLAVVKLNSFFGISYFLYLSIAAFSLLFGFYLLGFLPIKLPAFDLKRITKNPGGQSLGAFLLGLTFIFFEAPTCPSCAPALILIAGFMVTKGTILLGVSLLMTYVAGQAVPLVIAGTFAGLLKNIGARTAALEEYIKIAAGILLVLVALDLIYLA